jgi:hypothetical protein
MFLVKKNCLFLQLSTQTECGNMSQILNQHKKGILARGSQDFSLLNPVNTNCFHLEDLGPGECFFFYMRFVSIWKSYKHSRNCFAHMMICSTFESMTAVP